MIIGIGIDSIEIDRFTHWPTRSERFLKRIFSHEEIAYCCQNLAVSAQRFAVRFAAREALFKAISQAMPGNTIPFLTLCRAVTITKKASKFPFVELNWELVSPYTISDPSMPSNIKIWVSLSHSKSIATALIILEKNL